MNMRQLYTALWLIMTIFWYTGAKADSTDVATPATSSEKISVYRFEIDDDIMPAIERRVKRAVQEAEELGVDYIIIRMNTYGGLVSVADTIRTILLNAKPITVVWVDNNAASAGALISISCDSIYMSKSASIGAATVVSGEDGTQMPDKYQSYMRSTMRATAEATGRDPDIAEAMVDDRKVIEGIIDSGYTLTFTAKEALENDYSQGYAESFDEVLEQIGLDKSEIEVHDYSGSFLETVIAFLLHPVVNSLLMLMIFGGIFFELQSPGVGFPLGAAITGAVLYFAPLYLEGLAESWEIVMFFIGLVLLALEIFVVPGFGVTGISGIALMVSGLGLALIRNVQFDFTLTSTGEIGGALLRVSLIFAAMIALFFIFGKKLFESKLFGKLVLSDTQDTAEGYVSSGDTMHNLIGQKGITTTDLKPSGKIELSNNRYDAITEGGGLIEKGTTVKVVKITGSTLIVTSRNV